MPNCERDTVTMKKPNHIDLPDEFFIMAADDGKSICAGALDSAVYFLHKEDAISSAVKVSTDKPAIVYRCTRQLRVTV
jgi:hypothetical protein